MFFFFIRIKSLTILLSSLSSISAFLFLSYLLDTFFSRLVHYLAGTICHTTLSTVGVVSSTSYSKHWRHPPLFLSTLLNTCHLKFPTLAPLKSKQSLFPSIIQYGRTWLRSSWRNIQDRTSFTSYLSLRMYWHGCELHLRDGFQQWWTIQRARRHSECGKLFSVMTHTPR